MYKNNWAFKPFKLYSFGFIIQLQRKRGRGGATYDLW